MKDADKFPQLPRALALRVELALAVLDDGKELGLFDNLIIVAGHPDGIDVFDLDLQPNQANIQLLRRAADELEKYIAAKGANNE